MEEENAQNRDAIVKMVILETIVISVMLNAGLTKKKINAVEMAHVTLPKDVNVIKDGKVTTVISIILLNVWSKVV